MNTITEFIPDKGYPNLKNEWKGHVTAIAIVFVCFALPLLAFGLPAALWLTIPAIFALIFLLIALGSVYPVKVIISGVDRTFTYTVLNSFGREKDTVISYHDAKFNYGKTLIGRTRVGYRIVLYNHIFGKKITLAESDLGYRFKKEQLDQMASLLNKYRAY